MKLILLLVFVLALVVAGGLAYFKFRLDHAPDRADLEATLDKEVRKYQGKGSSAVMVGVYKDGKFFSKGYGSPLPDQHTVFELASVSKLLTTATLQILCDEGKLNMDATLGELVGQRMALAPEVRAITLRQLATHTSGLPGLPKSFTRKMTNLQNPYAVLEPADLYSYLKNPEGKRKPGRFEYSNLGMGLLGYVMEQVMHQDLESLVTEKLLNPLGMSHTAIRLSPELQAHLVQGYSEAGQPNPNWDFPVLAGAGAFKSNLEDMLKFVQANLEESFSLSGSLRKMHAKQAGGATGIGWMQPTPIDRFFGNTDMVWHNGRTGGYTSYVSIDDKHKTGVVVLSSKSVDITMLGMMLTRQVRTQSWAKL